MAEPETQYEIDDKGFATCPECGEKVQLGTVGTANLTRRHMGSKVCQTARDKRDKAKNNKKLLKNGSIMAFMKPKPIFNPPAVRSATPILQRRTMSLSEKEPGSGVQDPVVSTFGISSASSSRTTSTSKARGTEVPILLRLRRVVETMAEDVAEATENDRLARLAGPPSIFDDPEVDADDLWELVLNPKLKDVLGWGTEHDAGEMVRRGELGMAAVFRFVEYFVLQRGVNETLFEGKLFNLLEAAESRCSPTNRLNVTPEQQPSAVQQEDVIDVDRLEETDTHTMQHQPTQHSSPASGMCGGYVLQFQSGTSPHSAYPFSLHDSATLPWDYFVRRGVMTLYARRCSGLKPNKAASCQACRELPKNGNLQGITDRLKNGVHGNSKYQYHGFSGLHQVLRKKNAQIEFYRLRGLNQARSLLGKATALSEYKRFTIAIASGKVERVDRILRVGLSQKKGIRGLMAMLEAAAQKVYRPRSWTEEEDMRALLLWRLGGNRIAQINHRARGDPSPTYLRSRSFTPPLIPSHSQPTVLQVSENVKSVFSNVLDVVQSRLKTLHAVVMLHQ